MPPPGGDRCRPLLRNPCDFKRSALSFWAQRFFPLCLLLMLLLFISGCSKSDPERVSDSYRIRIGAKEFSFHQQMLYVMLSLEMYRLHVGAYPNRENNLEALVNPPEILEASGEWRGPYAVSPTVFSDPWGRRLIYTLDTEGKADIRSLGKDGIPSNDDIIAQDLFPDIVRELKTLPPLDPISIPTPRPSTS